MGLPHHASVHHWRDTFQLGARVRRNDPSREIQESSPRFQSFVAEESNEEKRVNLDLLDEVRE